MAEQEPSYLRAMLTSESNVYALLGSVATAAVLSIPLGFGVGAIPLIAFAAGEAIAAMYIPSLSTFRAAVDRRHRQAARGTTRKNLIDEIMRRSRTQPHFEQIMRSYKRMTEHVDSLYGLAADNRTQLSAPDVERLEDAGLEFLYVHLALLIIDDRAASINPREISQRIEAIDRDLAAPKPGADLRALQKARSDYQGLLVRHSRMLSRKTVLEAAVLAMPDQMEEIYQNIVTSPTADGLGVKLADALESLRLQEDIETELARDLSEAVPGLVVPMVRDAGKPRQAVAASQRSA